MANSTQRAMVSALKALGARLHRQGRHEVWRLPSGQLFVIPRSPSDGRALQNMRACLKRRTRVRQEVTS